MFKLKMHKKGIALFIVLATILVTVVLANVLLNIMLSHSRLTHHQVSRIQAYYASMAGMNVAYEGLRAGNWPLPSTDPNSFYIRTICNANRPGCIINPGDINEGNLPVSIQNVRIVVAQRGTNVIDNGIPVPGCNPCNPPVVGIDVCICSRTNYTYQ